jgi:hypothetical protein
LTPSLFPNVQFSAWAWQRWCLAYFSSKPLMIIILYRREDFGRQTPPPQRTPLLPPPLAHTPRTENYEAKATESPPPPEGEACILGISCNAWIATSATACQGLSQGCCQGCTVPRVMPWEQAWLSEVLPGILLRFLPSRL